MNPHEIGCFIARCRTAKALTQAQLAQQLGVSDKTISPWERGKTMPDLSLYEALCEALDVQISELLYAKKMTDEDKQKQGERSAFYLLKTKAQFETLEIFTEVLIVIGIIISITFTKVLADTQIEMLITMACGFFVWGFGIMLRIKIRKAMKEMES